LLRARPSGNLTGVVYLTSELGAKRLGLRHEIVPKVADFAVLAHPTYPSSAPFITGEGGRPKHGLADRSLQRID
jgi:hypothetical protein